MSNKTRLSNNNIELESIIERANSLPISENITSETDEYTSLLEEAIIKMENKVYAPSQTIVTVINEAFSKGEVFVPNL